MENTPDRLRGRDIGGWLRFSRTWTHLSNLEGERKNHGARSIASLTISFGWSPSGECIRHEARAVASTHHRDCGRACGSRTYAYGGRAVERTDWSRSNRHASTSSSAEDGGGRSSEKGRHGRETAFVPEEKIDPWYARPTTCARQGGPSPTDNVGRKKKGRLRSRATPARTQTRAACAGDGASSAALLTR